MRTQVDFERGRFMMQIAVNNDKPSSPLGTSQKAPQTRLVRMGDSLNDSHAQVEQDVGMQIIRLEKSLHGQLMVTRLEA